MSFRRLELCFLWFMFKAQGFGVWECGNRGLGLRMLTAGLTCIQCASLSSGPKGSIYLYGIHLGPSSTSMRSPLCHMYIPRTYRKP